MPVKSIRRRPLALLRSTALTGAVLLSFSSAKAQIVWQGDVDNSFGNGGNWAGDLVPDGMGVIAVFDGTGGTQEVQVSDEALLEGLEFAAGASSYTLSVDGTRLGVYVSIVNNSSALQTINLTSGSLQIGNGASIGRVTINSGNFFQFDGSSDASEATIVNTGLVVLRGTFGTATLSVGSLSGTGNVQFVDVAGHTIELGALGLDDTISGNIGSYDGVGDGSIIKVGTGTLTLSGNSNYSGGTRISAGTIVAASNNALGSGLVTMSGGALALSGAPTVGNNIDLTSAGTIRFNAGATGTLNGDITTNGQILTLDALGAGTINGDIDGGTSSVGKSGSGALTINGIVSGTGAGITAGSGTLVLNNANTYGGDTVLGDATLVVGHDDALSTSRLTVNSAGSALSVNKDVSLANDVRLVGGFGLTIDTAGHALDLAGAFETVGGPAPITKAGAGTLTLTGDNSGFASDVIISEGALDIAGKLGTTQGRIDYTGSDPAGTATVRVSGSDAAWTINDAVMVGDDGDGAVIIDTGGQVVSAMVAVAHNTNGVGMVTVSGASSAWTAGTMASIGHYGNGTALIEDGGRLESETIFIGGGSSSTGKVTVSGGGSVMQADTALSIGMYGNGTLNLTDGGRVSAVGLGIDVAAGDGDAIGTINFGAASGEAALAAGTLEAASITFGPGTGAVVFNHTGNPDGSDLVFSPSLTGQGTILHENGKTVLNADSSGFAGTTNVSGGTLLVGNRLGGTAVVEAGGALVVGDISHAGAVLAGNVQINAGGTLGGIGSIGGNVEVDGTLSAGNSPGTLTIGGDLTLNSASTSVFELNTPGVIGGAGATGNDLVNVGGDLTLGGTLDARVGAAGYYRLFNYGGSLTGTFESGTLTGTGGFVPIASNDPDIRYDLPGQVNLSVLGAGQTMQFWDGGDTTGNGTVDGGAGTWSGFAGNWTDSAGSANGSWGGSVGVFAGGAGGPVVVDGAQNFDTLQFSADGYELSGGTLALAPASGAAGTIQVDGNVAATISSSLTDGTSGQRLVKTGSGTLTLMGANSYTGGTEVQAGTLRGNAAAIRGDVANAGTLVFEEMGDAAFAGTITGFGGVNGLVEKRGAGALTLTGTSSLDWTIHDGRLLATAERFSGDVVIGSAGTLVFDQASDATYAGTITGLGAARGKVEKSGSGALTLGGASTLDWMVDEGTLRSAAQRFTGNVVVNTGAGFVFEQESDGEYAGTVAGTGRLAKEGAGALVLAGDSSGFAGTTALAGGALVVNGSLGGLLTVDGGGRLGGTGTVGGTDVAAGGVLAPGNSIGTLTVAGDLKLAAGSIYEVEVTPTGNASDLIHVTGRAQLGGTVSHIGADGNYQPNASYTILTADGGLSGTFDGVMSRYAFLAPTLSYGANAVTLMLQRNDATFCSAGLTANQCATGGGVESLGSGAPLYDAIVTLDAASAREAFDLLSADIHATSKSVLIEDSRFLREAATLRLRRTTGGLAGQTSTGQDGIDSPIGEDGLSAWGHGFGSWGHLDGQRGDGTALLNRSTGGLIAGIDTGLGESSRIGLLGGYSRTRLHARARTASSTSDNIHLGLYGGGQMGRVGIRLGAAYSWHDLDTRRQVSFTGFAAQKLDADSRASSAQAFGEIGYRITVNGGAFEPFVNLAWVHLRSKSFDESGGSAALGSARSTSDTGFSTVGLRGTGRIGAGLELYGSMGWRHAFGDRVPRLTQAFAGGDPFTVAGSPIARDAAVFEAGLDGDVAKGFSLGIAYSGQVSGRVQDHGVKGQIRWNF